MTYQIDGIDLDPQPTEHEWDDYPRVVDLDGFGRPIYAKYYGIVLRVPLTVSNCGYWMDDWLVTSFAPQRTISVPRPGTVDDFTTYTGAYIEYVRGGVVLKSTGMRGIEMRIGDIEV